MGVRSARAVGAVLLVALPCVSATEAHAVSPPPIDVTRLPAAAPAVPPRPSVQREVCAVPGLDPGHVRGPTQLDGLDLPAVWRLSRGAGQRVAVIDTGVASHRRLTRVVPGGDYVSTGDGARDCDGHGTLVAGIIAAAPEADGFGGVAPDAAVIAIRQSSDRFGAADDPGRAGVGDVDTLARAVRTAADLGASVIAISPVACLPASALDDRALGAALAYAVDTRDAVIVAAAGDLPADGSRGLGTAGADPDAGAGADTNTYADPDEPIAVSPAWYDDYVLTVGSVDAAGAASRFTRPGPWVDVAAPGEAVLSLSTVGDAMANTLAVGRGSAPIAGTGYAAAVVSGVAALIRSRFPGWTSRQVRERITATARRPPGGRDDFVGNGVVDPLAAVSTGSPPISRQTRPATPEPAESTASPPTAPPVTAPADVSTAEPRTVALTRAAGVLTGLLVVLTVRGVRVRLRGAEEPSPTAAAEHC